jgi:hypothetical protein
MYISSSTPSSSTLTPKTTEINKIWMILEPQSDGRGNDTNRHDSPVKEGLGEGSTGLG